MELNGAALSDVGAQLDTEVKKLLAQKISVDEKKNRLETDYDITVTNELEEEVNVMCNYGDMIEEKGEKKKAIKVVQRMLKLGKNTYEEIADITELTLEEVKKIEAEMLATA